MQLWQIGFWHKTSKMKWVCSIGQQHIYQNPTKQPSYHMGTLVEATKVWLYHAGVNQYASIYDPGRWLPCHMGETASHIYCNTYSKTLLNRTLFTIIQHKQTLGTHTESPLYSRLCNRAATIQMNQRSWLLVRSTDVIRPRVAGRSGKQRVDEATTLLI